MAVRQVEVTLVVSATFAANLPANNKVYASILVDPALAAVSQLQVPVTEAWVVQDLFVAASQTPDAIVEFKKNLTEGMGRTAPINGCIVTNVARPRVKPFVYEGASIVTIEAQNLAVIGTTAATVTFYVTVRKFQKD